MKIRKISENVWLTIDFINCTVRLQAALRYINTDLPLNSPISIKDMTVNHYLIRCDCVLCHKYFNFDFRCRYIRN